MIVLNLTASERTYLVDLLYAPAMIASDETDEAVNVLRDLSDSDSRATWVALNNKLRNAKDQDA